MILTIPTGGIIYILFRRFRWFEFLKIDKVIFSVRECGYSHRSYIPSSILYSLPDSLRVYSFTMFLSYYFKNILLLLVPCTGSVLTKIHQLWSVSETFDMPDIIYIFTARITVLFFIYKNKNRKLLFVVNANQE